MVPANIFMATIVGVVLAFWLSWDGLKFLFSSSKETLDEGDVNALIFLALCVVALIIMVGLGIDPETTENMWIWERG